MRVVLDTNVVVSGVIKEEGPPGQILRRLFQARQFISVTSLEILAEIREVLQRPKVRRYHGWTDEEIDEFVTFLYAESDVTEGTLTVNIARDPPDNKFLACASEATQTTSSAAMMTSCRLKSLNERKSSSQGLP